MVQDNTKKYPYKLCEIRTRKGDLSKRWYVEFYVWDENTDQLERKVDYSINRFKTEKERLAQANHLKKQIDGALAKGMFIRKKEEPVVAPVVALKPKDGITAESNFIDAILYCAKVKTAALSKRSGTTYKSIVKILNQWLEVQEYHFKPLGEVDQVIIYEFLDYLKMDREVDNITRNNYLVYCKAIFNFYVDRKVLPSSPCAGIKDLPENEKAHIPYLDEEKELIKDYLAERDPQLLLFCTFMYYTFARRNELRLSQVKNLGDKFHIPAYTYIFEKKEKVSKNNKSSSVIIPVQLEKIIQKEGLRNYPPDFFIFGAEGKPGPKPFSISYFSNKHRKVVKHFNFTKGHDMYSWKATGVIKLFKEIKDIIKIKEQCRHSDIRHTEKYLRELGLFDNKEVQNQFPEF